MSICRTKIEYVYMCVSIRQKTAKRKKPHKQHKQRHTQSRETHKINQSNSSISSFPCHLRPPMTSTTMTTTRRQHDAADWTHRRRLALPHHSFHLHHRPWNTMKRNRLRCDQLWRKILTNATKNENKKKTPKNIQNANGMRKMQFTATNEHDRRPIYWLHDRKSCRVCPISLPRTRARTEWCSYTATVYRCRKR